MLYLAFGDETIENVYSDITMRYIYQGWRNKYIIECGRKTRQVTQPLKRSQSLIILTSRERRMQEVRPNDGKSDDYVSMEKGSIRVLGKMKHKLSSKN